MESVDEIDAGKQEQRDSLGGTSLLQIGLWINK